MHVVLTRTELPRLRALGYEVFNPAYHASVYDQSANLNWDAEQQTTLPKAVFDELAAYNFFYNPVSERIADILNEYFDAIVVTINPDWLKEILSVYRGRVIYRTYGQVGSLSDYLWANGCGKNILERDNFWFVPHATEVAEGEQAWLQERMKVVPYTLPLDIFAYRDTWHIHGTHRPEIMATCPNIANGYYAAHYRYLQTHFPDTCLRLYGVQPAPVPDPRVVGTLAREQLLKRYQQSAGYVYTYDTPNVCYLPPLEMMTIGGPVIFLPGSLLARYYEKDAPGLAKDPEEARVLMSKLVDGDRGYIEEVINSQEAVRERYAPEHCDPIFDNTMESVLHEPKASYTPFAESRIVTRTKKRAYVLFHFPGGLIQFKDGNYTAAEGIPRVIRKLVQSILEHTNLDVVVTCRNDQFLESFGFFRTPDSAERLSFLRIDDPSLHPNPKFWRRTAMKLERLKIKSWSRRNGISSMLQNVVNTHTPQSTKSEAHKALKAIGVGFAILFLLLARFSYNQLIAVWNFAVKKAFKFSNRMAQRLEQTNVSPYIQAVNADPNAACVVIPHYYLFPETVDLKTPSVLYLPDYLPHFVKEPFEGNAEPNVKIGKLMAKQVAAVLTNSEFTRSYLPSCELQVSQSKIFVAPIPLLMPRKKSLDKESVDSLRKRIGEGAYIFYPTQNRPNKQIAFLLEIFAKIKHKHPQLKLVLTCCLQHVAEAEKAFKSLRLHNDVVLIPGVSDEELAYLYQNAELLCLTSTMEGNFPPQIFEALAIGTPVVASRLPLITEILGDDSRSLLLCEPLHAEEFIEKVNYALANRQEILIRQKTAYEILMHHAADDRFGEATAEMFRRVAA
jgi:glycosyltransferase involved in cell wall biosynthesis